MALRCELPAHLLPNAHDAGTPALWRTEIERRAVEIIEGHAELEDAELVHQQIADHLRSRRG